MKKNCSASGGKRPNLGVVRGQSTRNTPKFGISTPYLSRHKKFIKRGTFYATLVKRPYKNDIFA
jgi:hypothetical protein